MDFNSKKVSLIILFVISMFVSRSMFFFIDDPEGPNLLIVTVLALILYFLTLPIFLYFKTTYFKKFLLAIGGMVILVGGFLVLNSYAYKEKQGDSRFDYKNIEYNIEGKKVTPKDGVTKYFGNELRTDLELSVKTVEAHTSNLMKKLDIHDRASLAVWYQINFVG
jgi:hypothetical protein